MEKKFRLLLLLALLLTAATGAWAQSAFTAKEITSASQLTSTDDEAYVAACMPSDFLAVDADVAKAWTGAPTDGSAILIYAIDGDKIKMAVADYYKISTSQLSASIRVSNISNARHIAMYLCRTLLDVPFIKIGEEFGGRDHSTVINACEKVEKLLKNDPNFKQAIDVLKEEAEQIAYQDFNDLIVKGDFDRLLLRPQNILLQVFVNEVSFVKISRLIKAIIILIIAVINIDVVWSIDKIITLIFMLFASVIVFLGIFILAASYCFLTVKGLEVRNVFTDGGKHMAQYPIGIFKKGFVFFFTFIIPYAFVNYYPLMYFIGKETNILYAFSPLLVILFLIPCLIAFSTIG